MNFFKKFWTRVFPPSPPPPPPVPLDEQSGPIGDILRMGEALGGNAAIVEQEQIIANKKSSPKD